MIRVEITKTVWRTKDGACAIGEPVFSGAEEEGWRQEHQVLLVQEFDNLDTMPIVAYLNGLQTPSVCSCGHPKHSGRCAVYTEGGLGYSGDRCECTDYLTAQEKAYLAEIKESHQVIEDLEIARATHRSVAHERKETIDDLKGQIDRLRTQKGKRR
jgi:hypothetical protein